MELFKKKASSKCQIDPKSSNNVNNVTEGSVYLSVNVKVKYLRYRTGCGPEGSRGIALLFYDHSTKRW
jgi:hypothetical protein